MNKKLLYGCALVGVGVAGRLLPHFPNATPITALSIAAGSYLGRRYAVFLPLVAMAFSDLVIGFYDWRVLMSVYGSFVLIGLVNSCASRYPKLALQLPLAVLSSLLFYLVTNFVVWATSLWYPKTLAGLLYCYTLGLPFARTMLLGDLAYTLALCGSLAVVMRARKYRGAVDKSAPLCAAMVR